MKVSFEGKADIALLAAGSMASNKISQSGNLYPIGATKFVSLLIEGTGSISNLVIEPSELCTPEGGPSPISLVTEYEEVNLNYGSHLLQLRSDLTVASLVMLMVFGGIVSYLVVLSYKLSRHQWNVNVLSRSNYKLEKLLLYLDAMARLEEQELDQTDNNS